MAQAARPRRMRLGDRARARRAHREHVGEVRDAGRVEAQRLVEVFRVLPSRKEGMRCGARCGLQGEGAKAWGSGSASGTHTEDPIGGLGTEHARRAHVKHAAHDRDAGRVEGQLLVERRRALPSWKKGMRRGARGGPEGAGARAWASRRAQAARTRRTRVEGWGEGACVASAHRA